MSNALQPAIPRLHKTKSTPTSRGTRPVVYRRGMLIDPDVWANLPYRDRLPNRGPHPIVLKCPECVAPVGSLCTGGTSPTIEGFHVTRVQLAIHYQHGRFACTTEAAIGYIIACPTCGVARGAKCVHRPSVGREEYSRVHPQRREQAEALEKVRRTTTEAT